MERREVQIEELIELKAIAAAKSESARLAERAEIIVLWSEGSSITEVAQRLNVTRHTVSKWIRRYYEGGIDGLRDEARSGRPQVYGDECLDTILDVISRDPKEVGATFSSWSIRNLERYMNEVKGISIKRSRINRLLQREGYHWVQERANSGSWVQTKIEVIREREAALDLHINREESESEAKWS